MKNILLLLSSIFLMSLSECADKKNPDGTCNYSYLSDEELGLIVHDKEAAREAERKYGNTVDSYGYYEFDTLYFTNNNGDSVVFTGKNRIFVNPGAVFRKCKTYTPLVAQVDIGYKGDSLSVTFQFRIGKNSAGDLDINLSWGKENIFGEKLIDLNFLSLSLPGIENKYSDNSKEFQKQDELTINNKVYYSIYFLEDISDEQENMKEIYFSQFNGIIKIVFNNGEEFNRLP